MLYDYASRNSRRGRIIASDISIDRMSPMVRAVVDHHDVQGCGPGTIRHRGVRAVIRYKVGTPGKVGGRS